MKLLKFSFYLIALLSAGAPMLGQAINGGFARDPHQPVDDPYAEKIKQYTTDPSFLSPLIDYLPASKTVPTPMKILGDVAGAPDMLPYAEDTYKYFRLLAASSPRVQVVTIGHSEEGREMIAVAIADESLLKGAKDNDAKLAKLADPRTIGMDDVKAAALVDSAYPVYYITGTIHSTETGALTALMELAYRLAVDDSPYIKYIRSHMIVLITPVVEVDGRDRMVDIYKWHKAHPGQQWPRLMYWGHYVAHDNNRDAMGMTLNLTRDVLDTYLSWHAQVLHDLHESVAFLYDNTIGDGPYNPWIDPTLSNEWQELGWNNISQLQNFGMPGVFTHGDFDTWGTGYLMSLAATHNGISRLYETFGNDGADTEKRILRPEEYSRTWYRQNPPLPVVTWSQRDNNNYEESALLSTLSYFSKNTHHFLENYYEKSKRSILKASVEGPVAYVLPANEAEGNRQLQLLEALKRQHVEVSQLTDAVTTLVAPVKHGDKPTEEKLPAESLVIRLDQPYSRVADSLLDHEYWAPDDPQKHPYDDTGWSFTELFNLKVVRVTDSAFLSAKMSSIAPSTTGIAGKLVGTGNTAVIANTGQCSLLALLYALKNAHISIAEKPFDAEGKHFAAGSLVISDVADATLTEALKKFSLNATRFTVAPAVASHPAVRPRIAFMHTWLDTQTEGWWRYAFDNADVPYKYISTQTAGVQADLRSQYDVIIFAPVGGVSSQEILNGVPLYGNALPWEKTALTPNLGLLDSTPDMRPGMGEEGLAHLRKFVEQGGLLITSEDTASFAIESGLAPGVSVDHGEDAKVVGTVLNTIFVAPNHPVAWGYGASVPVISQEGMVFNVSNMVGRFGGRSLMDPYADRPSGRGNGDESDIVQGRKAVEPETPTKQEAWEPKPLNEEQARNNPLLIPDQFRPDVILRFSDSKSLLLSGLLDKSSSIAEHAILVDAHLGEGNVLLFATNPVYRGETVGDYPLVFNAIMNYQHLGRDTTIAK